MVVPGSWAKIYIDGSARGRTGEVTEIPVTPGTHALRLENDVTLPYEDEFTVSSGETRIIEVTALVRKPATVRLGASFDDACTVDLDGTNRGTVGGLARTLSITDPDTRHRVMLSCPDGQQTSHDLPAVLAGSTIDLPAP